MALRLYHPQYGFTGTPVVPGIPPILFTNGVGSIASLYPDQIGQLHLYGYTVVDDTLPASDVPVFLGDISDPTSGPGAALRAAFDTRAANRVLIFGNSIAAADTIRQNATAAQWFSNPRGIFTWANEALRQRFRLVGNIGVSGNKTADMLARFDADSAPFTYDWLLFFGVAINDVQNDVPLATTQANVTAIVGKALAQGKRVILCTDISSGNGAGQLTTAARKQAIHDVNHWLRRFAAATPGVLLVDLAPVLTDPSTGLSLTGYTLDGTHPNSQGAAKLGNYLAGRLAALNRPAIDPLPISNIDTSNALTNGMMLGNTAGLTTGLQTGTSDQSGAVAPTFTPTKVARTDGLPGEWQQFAVTAGDLQVRLADVVLPAGFAVGDQVSLAVEFETDANWTGNPALRCGVWALTSGFSVLARQYSLSVQYLSGEVQGRAAASGIMLAGPLTLPATTGRLDAFVWFDTTLGGPGSGTFRIGRTYLAKTSNLLG